MKRNNEKQSLLEKTKMVQRYILFYTPLGLWDAFIAVAFLNMKDIFVQFDVFHEERSELKAEQLPNMYLIFVQFDVFHEERSELKAEQRLNMYAIFVQFDVFHKERSELKVEQP